MHIKERKLLFISYRVILTFVDEIIKGISLQSGLKQRDFNRSVYLFYLDYESISTPSFPVKGMTDFSLPLIKQNETSPLSRGCLTNHIINNTKTNNH